jgi:hypothetical protein
MTNKVRWHVFDDADVDSFNVYRAITGLTVTFPNALQSGDKLTFAATSPQQQTVTLRPDAPSIDTVLADINSQAKGIEASKSTDNTELFIRCTAKTNPKLKLFSCSFLTHLGEQPRIIVAKLEWSVVGNVLFEEGTSAYGFDDENGDPLDWYHVTSIKDSVESIPSQDQQALLVPEDFCVVEGRIVDIQNNPISGAEVKASIMIPVGTSDNAGITVQSKSMVSDSLGRWNLPILQKQQVLFEIPAIRYNQVVEIPEQPYILFKDLKPLNDHYFAPAGEPEGGV